MSINVYIDQNIEFNGLHVKECSSHVVNWHQPNSISWHNIADCPNRDPDRYRYALLNLELWAIHCS